MPDSSTARGCNCTAGVQHCKLQRCKLQRWVAAIRRLALPTHQPGAQGELVHGGPASDLAAAACTIEGPLTVSAALTPLTLTLTLTVA